ncbi:MAG TPA: class I SAM-dependent methyltransferase [Terracidiphilus sp.]|jgi:SAM-dependent methyltransferase
MNEALINQAPDFNRLARLYRWMEFFSFGPWLWLTRRTFLDHFTRARRALVLGDGDGRFTARLLRENPTIDADAVDASGAMLDALLRRAGPHASRVCVHLADIREWQPAAFNAPVYDLIATHFFLDCLTTREIQSVIAHVRSAVSPSALWVVSEFAIPSGWRGRLVARPLVASLYLCFGWLTGLTVRTLPDHALALREGGFALVERRSRLGGLLIAELWSAGPPDSTR